MPKISRTTNPTSLKELDAKNFTIRTRTHSNGVRSFWLERFDFAGSGLPTGLEISCVAHAGSTEEFFQLGLVENPSNDIININELAVDRPLKFRFLVSESGNPKLIAFADNIRAVDESGLLGNSLVDIQPVDLHGATWKIEIPPVTPGADKPILLVERQLFPTAQAAAKNVWIAVLVMPEVMRQIARVIVENSDSLDDSEIWISSWKDFLQGLKISEIAEDADEIAKGHWVDEVVASFCSKPGMKQQLNISISELSGE